jgi:hypothetical protein
MTNLKAALETIHRPKTLMRAAKSALGEYDRTKGLQRLLGKSETICPEEALRELLPLEQDCETRRQTGRVAYSVARHLEVMVAIIAEASLLPEFKPRNIPQG